MSNKTPDGHIAHPTSNSWTKLDIEQTPPPQSFSLFFEKHCPLFFLFFCKFKSLLHNSLVKNGTLIIEKKTRFKIFNVFSSVFGYFNYFISLKSALDNHFYYLGSSLPKKIFESRQCSRFLLRCYYLFWRRGLFWINLNPCHPKEDLCQVWLKLAQWFLRRLTDIVSRKIECIFTMPYYPSGSVEEGENSKKFTTTIMMTNNTWVFGSGELKIQMRIQIQHLRYCNVCLYRAVSTGNGSRHAIKNMIMKPLLIYNKFIGETALSV